MRLYTIALAALLATTWTPGGQAMDTKQLIRHNCTGCHVDPAEPEGPLTRMDAQRKTPEGWEMTLVRMRMVHKAPFTDPEGGSEEDVLRRMIRYFADNQGLSPSESNSYRYILERRLNTIDVPEDAEFAVMCARCHSVGRVALQRRSEAEWRHLVHFHLVQFPTTEYQAGGRDRDWIGTALDRTVPMLTKQYGLESADWDAWQAAKKPSVGGDWRLAGHMPGRGAFEGRMRASASKDDPAMLDVEIEARLANGELMKGSGKATVYTGYEWRARIDLGHMQYQQVLAATADGSAMNGRMFLSGHEELGIDLHAAREDGSTRVLAIQPAYLRAGETATVTVVGTALSGRLDAGPGVKLVETLETGADRMVVRLQAASDTAAGARALSVGKARLDDALTVYSAIDRIEVTPGYAVGRVGDNGGPEPVVQAIFEAVGYGNGADGEAGTDDDLRIGVLPASWSVSPWDDKAAADRDLEFAGSMDKDSGVFTPAAAGPNPERKYGTNNAGNLKVTATVSEGDAQLQGDAHLLVTVQRWNNPPIR